MADRRVRLILEAQVDAFKRGMDQAARSASDVRSSAAQIGREWSRASRTMQADMNTVGAGYAAVGAAIVGVYGNLVSVGTQYNTLQQVAGRALETMTGSASAAAEQMERLHAFADESPFARQTWIQAQQQLMAFGMEAERVVPTLEGVQNAVAAIGGGDAEIMRLVDILGQIEGQGKITGQELQRLGQMGINAAEIIGDAMGVSGNEIREQITAGALDAETAITALTDGMMMRFDGAAEGLRETMTGAIDRLKAAWRDLGSILAEPLVSPDGGGFLVDLTNSAADFLRLVQRLPDPVVQTAGALTGLAGVATAGYGAMMLLVPQFVAFRDASRRLAAELPRTSSAIGTLGRTAAIAGGALGVMYLVDQLARIGDVQHDVRRWAANIESDIRSVGVGAADASIGFTDLGAATQDWWRGTASSKLAVGEIDNIGAAMTSLNMLQMDLSSHMAEFWGMNASAVERNELEAAFQSIDAAVSNLVNSGDIHLAAEQLAAYEEDARAAGHSSEDLGNMLPGTAAALLELKNSGELSAQEMRVLDEALGSLGEGSNPFTTYMNNMRAAISEARSATSETTPEMEGLEEALAEVGVTTDGVIDSMRTFLDVLFEAGLLTQGVMEAEAAFESQLRRVDESVQQLTDSLTEEYIAKGYSEEAARALAAEQIELGHVLNDTKDGFDLTTDAGEQAQEAFFGVADRGRDLTRALAENDATQSEVQDALRRTYDSLVATGEGFGMTTEDAAALAREVLGIPDDATIDSWMSDEAKRVAQETNAELDRLDGRHTSSTHSHTVTRRNIVIHETNSPSGRTANFGITERAHGGAVFGPGTATSDSIPAWLSNGEHVLTAREVQLMGGQQAVYRFRQNLRQMPSARNMIPAYAAGGAVQARQITEAIRTGAQSGAAGVNIENITAVGGDTQQVVNRVGDAIFRRLQEEGVRVGAF